MPAENEKRTKLGVKHSREKQCLVQVDAELRSILTPEQHKRLDSLRQPPKLMPKLKDSSGTIKVDTLYPLRRDTVTQRRVIFSNLAMSTFAADACTDAADVPRLENWFRVAVPGDGDHRPAKLPGGRDVVGQQRNQRTM